MVVFVVARRMEPVLSFHLKEMKPSASEASRSEARLQGDARIWCAIWAGPAIFCCALLVPNHERDVQCERRWQLSISACRCGFFLYIYIYFVVCPIMCPWSRVPADIGPTLVPIPNDVGPPCKSPSQIQQLNFSAEIQQNMTRKEEKGNKRQPNKSSWANQPWLIDISINPIHFHVLTKWERGKQMNQQTAAVQVALHTLPFDDEMADGGKWLRRLRRFCSLTCYFLPLPDEVVTHYRLPTVPSSSIYKDNCW